MPFVSQLVSVLLPVKNAQATLFDAVHQVLEVMTDYGQHFEVLILDDGSTDATSEVAQELCCHYPQIRLIRHGSPRGAESILRSGIEHSRGDWVMLRESTGRLQLVYRRPEPAKPTRISSQPCRPNYLSRTQNLAQSCR